MDNKSVRGVLDRRNRMHFTAEISLRVSGDCPLPLIFLHIEDTIQIIRVFQGRRKAGVAIKSVLDMKILFDQIPFDKISVSMTMKALSSRSWRSTLWRRKTGRETFSTERHNSK